MDLLLNSTVFSPCGCWIFITGIQKNGYASIHRKGMRVLAHRLSFAIYKKEEIKSDLVIDHLCRVRNCVNPQHLRQITFNENVMCGNGMGAINRNKTHCKRGHEFIHGSYWITSNGGKQCAACIKITLRKRKPLKDRTVCRAGHKYSEFGSKNSRGYFECKICRNKNVKKRYWLKKLVA